ncbi:MAG: sugar ABC transporter substrate-binding protein [Maritimibacter sp.]
MQITKLIGASVLGLGLTLSQALAADVSGKTLGIVVVTSQSESLAEWTQQLTTAAETLGWDVIVKDGENNPALLATKIPELLVQGADGIITMAVDAPLISEGLTSAKEQGVPVIATDVGVNPAGAELFTGVYTIDDYKLGEIMGNYILDKDPDAVAVGQTIQIVYAANNAVEGAKSILGEKLVEIADTDAANLVQSFTQTTVDLVQGHPDAKWFVTCCDFAPLMVLPALQSVQADDVTFVGRIENVSTLQAIRGGSKAAIVANRPYYGLAAIDAMAAFFADGTEIPATRPDLTGDLVVVDASNVPEDRMYPFADELAVYQAAWAEKYGK